MRLTKHLRECFVKAVFADIPKPVEPTVSQVQDALYENFHPLIKAVFDDDSLRKHLEGMYYYYVNGIGGQYVKNCGQDYAKLPIYAEYIKNQKAYDASKQQLFAVADGCSNLKQLQEALPELVKYMVSEAKPTPINLPEITGTVDALKALGWKQ